MIPSEIIPQVLRFQTTFPVSTSKLAEELGIKIYQSDLPAGVSGKIVRDGAYESESGFVIFVSKNEGYFRQRFTAAHEIGHYILHKNLIGNGIEENYMLRAKGISNKIEAEANQFAADLLMPFHLIEKLVESGCTELSELAKKLQVSEIAMAIRLGYPT